MMKTVIVSFGMGLVLLGLGGCSGPKGAMETYPVQGEVLLNGQPATEAVVILHPRFDYDKTADPPRGEVNDEGVFELSTYGDGDGAPAGTYKVAILPPSSAEADEGAGRFSFQQASESKVNPYQPYSDPETSGLTVTIPEARTTLDPFRLGESSSN